MNSSVFDQLKTAYQEDGLVLVLGAGVSIDSGLPTWSKLLQQVCDDMGYKVCVNRLKRELSLPAIASLLEEKLGNRKLFVKHIRNALYHNFKFYTGGSDTANPFEVMRSIQETNPTLRAVAALCAKLNPNKREFVINPHIHSVVTFNLDWLLQGYVRARYQKPLLRTVERASAGSTPGKISLYHMHGLLRYDKFKDDLSKNAPDAVVLTEQDYFDFFNEPTSLFNYTFLYLLREHPCCFIGLSMKDDNIRRLLHYSKLERYKALKAEKKHRPDTIKVKLARHFAILPKNKGDSLNDATTQTLRPLGVRVLWVDDVKLIPDTLKALYGSSDAWNTVF